MRQVIVEHMRSKEVRVINVGIDWDRIKVRPNRPKKSHGIVCSPRILVRGGSDFASFRRSRSWKDAKRGNPHAKRGWQRHPDRKPSCRRHRWGKVRGHSSPSARVLNEMGRCIYPCVDWMDYMEFMMEGGN